MITYRELHTFPGSCLFVIAEEAKRFVKDIDTLYPPQRYDWPGEVKGYYISAPICIAGSYTTLFELITNMGWEYKSTYYQKDHTVLTFVKVEK